MRLVRTLLTAFAVLLSTPSVAQGPAPAMPTALASEPAAGAGPASAGTGSPDMRDLGAWLDGFLPYALEHARIPGAVVVVVRRDGILLQRGYGFADVARRTPVKPETTMFRPGSVSKLFTWTAVMQQVEEGRLNLDQDVNTYLDFRIPPYQGKPITLRHIMTHTAGFEESVRYLISSDPKAVQPLARLMRDALPRRVFAPGTTPAYSNYATALAGYMVQRVSGVPFDDYVERRIFRPLAMRHATFRQPLPPAFAPFMAQGYPDSTQPPKPFEIVVPGPAGSLAASGADMGRFMIAHLNGGRGVLRPETARLMHDYQARRLGPLNTMALGFYEQRVNGHRAIAHGGDLDHFHTYLWLFPDKGLGLYISMNSAGIDGASQAIRSALFHKFADRYLPGAEPGGQVDAATAREHVALVSGHYVSSRGSFTNFLRVLGLLQQYEVTATEDGKLALPGLDGLSAAARDWTEVAPFVWRDRLTGERLAAEVQDGRVVRVSTDAISPFMMLLPASFAVNTAWLYPALFAALALVLIAALGWPVGALARRHYGAALPFEGRARTAWRASRLFAWAAIAVVVGWGWMISSFISDTGSIGGPLDWLIQSLRILTPLAAFGLLASALWHVWLSWRAKRRWTVKLGGVLLMLSAAVLCWVTVTYNLYGLGLVY
jgi:CubicO group peptidase (beta-lactamase class C family)